MSTDQLEENVANGRADDAVIDQPTFDKDRWMSGPSDIVEDEVYVESLNTYVKVRGLTAGQLARIQDQCLTMKGDMMKIDSQRMAALKFAAGVKEPQFNEQEANYIEHTFGPAFSLVVGVFDDISKASEEDVQKARNRFRPRR